MGWSSDANCVPTFLSRGRDWVHSQDEWPQVLQTRQIGTINISNEQRSLRLKRDNPTSHALASARLICLVASAKLPSFGYVKDISGQEERTYDIGETLIEVIRT